MHFTCRGSSLLVDTGCAACNSQQWHCCYLEQDKNSQKDKKLWQSLTVYCYLYFPHVSRWHVVIGTAFIFTSIFLDNSCDFQIFIITGKTPGWKKRTKGDMKRNLFFILHSSQHLFKCSSISYSYDMVRQSWLNTYQLHFGIIRKTFLFKLFAYLTTVSNKHLYS